ncbi:unnamed protein product, partial [Ectocarpus sp. 12 AP-2014]
MAFRFNAAASARGAKGLAQQASRRISLLAPSSNGGGAATTAQARGGSLSRPTSTTRAAAAAAATPSRAASSSATPGAGGVGVRQAGPDGTVAGGARIRRATTPAMAAAA